MRITLPALLFIRFAFSAVDSPFLVCHVFISFALATLFALPMLPYPILPYPTLPYLTLSYLTLSYPILSYPTLPYPMLSTIL